jgi:uncharacterized membrane protein affecting hemolysin expression
MTNIPTKMPKKSAKLFRWVQLLIAGLGLLALLQWWNDSNQQGQRLFAEQSSVLMRETLKALSQTAAYLIENDQLDGLTALTQQLASNPYLHDVVVYDANGVRLSESPDSEPARLLYAPQHNVALQPMVQEIYQGEQLLGYIKISLKQDTGFSAVSSAWHAMMEQMLWMLGLAAVIALMARSSLLWLSHKLATNRQLHHTAIDSHEHLPS